MSITEEGFGRWGDLTTSETLPPIAEWEDERDSKDADGEDITTVLPLPKEHIVWMVETAEITPPADTTAMLVVATSSNIDYKIITKIMALPI